MIKRYGILLFGCVLLSGALTGWAEGTHRFGAGVHYLYALEDLDLDSGNEDGIAYVFSYQYAASELLKLRSPNLFATLLSTNSSRSASFAGMRFSRLGLLGKTCPSCPTRALSAAKNRRRTSVARDPEATNR